MSTRIRIASVALVGSMLVFAACTLKQDQTEDFHPAETTGSTHKNAPHPGEEVSDSPPSVNPMDYLNPTSELFKGMTKADFTKEKITSAAETVSLRDFDTPVKNQGSRGWCTAFAQVATVENMVKHTYGDTIDLSEIDHWMNYQQYACEPSAAAAKSKYIVPETSYPYNGSPISGYKSTAIAKVNNYRGIGKLSDVFAAIKLGHPVVVGLDVNPSWNSPGADGKISLGGGVMGGHALAVIGYSNDAAWGGGGYLLIKNSWGSKWGDRGYARVPYNYCSSYDCYFFEMLGVDYKEHAPAPIPPPDAGPVTPDAGPTPTPDAGPTPGPDAAPPPPPPPPPPTGEPTAWDIDCVAEKDPSRPDRFKPKLVAPKNPSFLNQVSYVTYDVDESFGAYQYWTTNNPTNGFAVPFFYRTWAHHWQTNGAVVVLKSGRVLYLAGAPVDW
ncbi:MAG: C1 family peptidase [Polyangiales bacterium]